MDAPGLSSILHFFLPKAMLHSHDYDYDHELDLFKLAGASRQARLVKTYLNSFGLVWHTCSLSFLPQGIRSNPLDGSIIDA